MMMKRLLDFSISLLAILMFSPILAFIAVGVHVQDGGPSLFGQQRVGKGGEAFRMWKFRSMVVNAEKIGGYSTVDGDPRITSLGRFIRRTSLDELPQLFNVLFGEMSIVGPRPDVPAQRSLYSDDEWETRHSVLPGITGLAQSTLRSEATAEQRKALDLHYALNNSLGMDLRIILRTLKQVIFKGGN